MTNENVIENVLAEMKKAVVGKDEILEKVLCAMIARGHILLEDIPGLGKTTMATAFAKVCNLDSRRLQFTPDVLPSDIVGFHMMEKGTGNKHFVPGVVFTHLFLADEINRTSAKSQSALLEVMEEGNATVDGISYELKQPFIVIATQNPAGSAGTQLLPESQLDRFMIQLSMGYPGQDDEVEILRMKHDSAKKEEIKTIISKDMLQTLQEKVDTIFLHDTIYKYIVSLMKETRNNEYIELGGSPRASVALMRMASAYALMSGREYVIPKDVAYVFPDVIRHRLILNSKARIEKITKQAVIHSIIEKVEKPKYF